MSKAYRCDNPACREFFDPYELQEQYAIVEIGLHDREKKEDNYVITGSATVTLSNCIIPSPKPAYCFCPKCTYMLKELVGIK